MNRPNPSINPYNSYNNINTNTANTLSASNANLNANIPPPQIPPQFMPPMMPMPPFNQFPFPAPPPVAPSTLLQNTSGISSAAAPVEVGKPNCTLYIQNLPEKPNPLKHLPPVLTELFSKYGQLKKPVVLRKGVRFNGQAWIIFERLEDAEKALKALQGTRVWGSKSMVIRYARFKSDCMIESESELAEEKKLREADRVERAKNPRMTRRQILNRLMSGNPSNLQSVSISGPDVLLPNKTLFIQNIPPGYPIAALSDLFRRHAGFQDLRTVPNRPDVAFVEYENETQAGAVRQIIDKTEIVPGGILRVSFARR